MIDIGALIYSTKRTRNPLERGSDESWLGVQLVGGKPDEIAKAVEIVNRHDFSVLDFNLGCPAPKVAKKGKGAGLAKEFDIAAYFADIMVKKSRFPVTAKIRIQDPIDPVPTILLSKKLQDVGIRAITIHGRTLEAIYSGPCHRHIIAAVQDELKIQVIANGGVTDVESYEILRKETGCGPVMIARGAMGNPWIFEFLNSTRVSLPTTEELSHEMETHFNELVEYYGEKVATKLSRKIILDYMEGRGFLSKLKCQVVKINSTDDFNKFMEEIRNRPRRGG
jgi:tRNA-dihydrouridine synthase B